jgi:hypothetical protein
MLVSIGWILKNQKGEKGAHPKKSSPDEDTYVILL